MTGVGHTRSATPDADAYAARFRPFTPPPDSDTAFKVTQLRTNAVLRWEYRPGSTQFLVWAHGREADTNERSRQSWRRDYRDLFGLHPDNPLPDQGVILAGPYLKVPQPRSSNP